MQRSKRDSARVSAPLCTMPLGRYPLVVLLLRSQSGSEEMDSSRVEISSLPLSPLRNQLRQRDRETRRGTLPPFAFLGRKMWIQDDWLLRHYDEEEGTEW